MPSTNATSFFSHNYPPSRLIRNKKNKKSIAKELSNSLIQFYIDRNQKNLRVATEVLPEVSLKYGIYLCHYSLKVIHVHSILGLMVIFITILTINIYVYVTLHTKYLHAYPSLLTTVQVFICICERFYKQFPHDKVNNYQL